MVQFAVGCLIDMTGLDSYVRLVVLQIDGVPVLVQKVAATKQTSSIYAVPLQQLMGHGNGLVKSGKVGPQIDHSPHYLVKMATSRAGAPGHLKGVKQIGRLVAAIGPQVDHVSDQLVRENRVYFFGRPGDIYVPNVKQESKIVALYVGWYPCHGRGFSLPRIVEYFV